MRGVTLVELLVVVAIIGILVGLSLPAYWEAKVEAQRVSCRTVIKSYASGYNERGRLVIQIPQEANCHVCHYPRYNAGPFIDSISKP